MNQQPQITSEALRAKMKLPPPLAGPYQKVVLAGQKIMFSETMLPQIQALMKGPDPLGKKIGDGATALLAILIDQSHHTLPPQLLIPAGMEFCTDFAELLRHAGMQVADTDVSTGIETMIATVMQKLGVTPDKLAGLAKGQAPQPGAQPAAPQQPAPQAPPAAGAPAAAQPNTSSVATDAEGN